MRAVLLLLAMATLASGAGLADDQSGQVDLPGVGKVLIETSRHRHELPSLTFRDGQGRVLLRGRLGVSNPSIFRVNPLENADGRENPVLRYAVVRALASEPIVFAVAMYGGGTDCEYTAAAFGESHKRLASLLPREPVVNAEGGMYFGDLGKGRGPGFAVWNFIWGAEGHTEPHRYRLELYRFDASAGGFKKFAAEETKAAYRTDTDALLELGVQYPNLLHTFPALSC